MQNRFELIGGIASGKTTFAKLLQQEFQVLIENFRDNPFWEAFYEDPSGNSFETEITFTLQHYHQMKAAIGRATRPVMSDFSLWLDAAYAEVTLSGNRLRLYRAIHKELADELELPRTLINLKCDSRILLNRIRARGRDQEKNITLPYLDDVQSAIDSQIATLSQAGVNILNIDSENMNFAANEDDKTDVKHLVLSEEDSTP